MAAVMETATGFPGYNGRMPFENGMLPEMLLEQGYNTFAIGKVASVAGGRKHARRPLHPLAAGTRLRALLRLSGRRNQPVVSGPDLRQPFRAPAQVG
ncbi:MAG: hypothetical protein R3A10_01345 [Caldilineaceae bacterium]